MSCRISICAVGTELTSGQILNRNAQWISQRLARLGISTQMHLTVPDDRKLMLEAFTFCKNHSDLMFVSGGLGPTTDDFTREVISQWTGKELRFDAASFQHLQDRLTARGIPVREAQRQQCYFPSGANILVNRVGTAHAFSMQLQDFKIYVLPGPPNEIDAVWTDWILADMQTLAQSLDPLMTVSWDTLGFGEGEISHRVEDVTEGCPFEKGYRVHLPYVEVKLSYPLSRQTEAQYWITRIENAIGNTTVVRNGEDLAEKWVQALPADQTVEIEDLLSGSHLLQRILPAARNLLAQNRVHFRQQSSTASKSLLQLAIKSTGPHAALVSLNLQGQYFERELTSHFRSDLMSEREKQFFAELALVFWIEKLQTCRD